jgi:hypothetical protein
MTKTRLAEFAVNIRKVPIGDSREHVLAILGPPTRQELSQGMRDREWKERYLIYDVEFVGSGPGNVHDKIVELIFDRQDRLLKILSSVDGIDSR